MNYRQHYSTRVTPQSEAIPGTAKNDAGGYAFPVDDWTRLDRFLILGSEGGSYYVKERELTRANAEAVQRCLAADPVRAVNRIVEVSHAGRAPKNDPALFALAMAMAGTTEAKEAATRALPLVARTGTHLLHFIHYVEGFRGWGRDLRGAVSNWYNSQRDLAYQVVKYQQRDGWSHRDVLRLAHVRPRDAATDSVFKWVVKGEVDGTNISPIIAAFELAKKAGSAQEIARLITEYNLPREAVPTQWLNSQEVWDALLQDMPLTAMVRNLGKMTSVGVIAPFSLGANYVRERLNQERIHAARVHPLALLVALKTYAQGHGDKGSLKWEPVPQVVDALDEAFYLAFQNVEPTGKRMLLALDVSGSMAYSMIAGTNISAREGSAAMALLTAKTERSYHIMAFATNFIPLDITPRQRLDDAVRAAGSLAMGGTDCALPMLWALKNRVEVDAFVIYTDSETWFGHIHPAQALRAYRERFNPRAKLVVVGMTSEGFSIAPPDDGGSLDVVGFDAAAPAVMADFVRA